MEQPTRRRAVISALAVVAVGLLASGCNWYQLGNVSGHTADNPVDTITPANAPTLTSEFTLTTGPKFGGPIEAEAEVNGVVYAASYDITTGSGTGQTPTLFAFSADGTTGCRGTPITCSPLWTASLVGSNSLNSRFHLAVNNGVVYTNGGLGLEAFDAAGKTNCSGSPKVCKPLWQASVNWDNGAPTVSNGIVFATSGGALEAFDANGSTNCSRSPKICAPLWTAPVSASVAVVTVSGGIAYLQSSAGGTFGTIVALDANGKTGCSGTPEVCTPLWEYALTEPLDSDTYVSVSGTTLYVGSLLIVSDMPPDVQGSLQAFDANGVSDSSGTPVVCSPLWTSPDTFPTPSPVVVGDGFAFWTPFSRIQGGHFAAFDADGCSNTECNPVWTSSIVADPVAVGGSVVYASDGTNVYAFDAGGTVGCTASVCDPLWSTNRPIGSTAIGNAIVANGTLYVSTGSRKVVAYGLP
jgi:hypothetical protein